MIIKKIACFILLFLASNFYCQDSIKKKSHNFLIEVGVSENVPLKGRYLRYYQYTKRYASTGYFVSVGYNFKLNKHFSFIPTLSYYFNQEKIKYLNDYNWGCFDFDQLYRGTYKYNSKFHSIALSSAFVFKLKRFYFESSIGFSYVAIQKQTSFYSDETQFKTTTFNRSPIIINTFVTQKFGYELVKNRLDLLVGSYMFIRDFRGYQPAINPTLSFRIKL